MIIVFKQNAKENEVKRVLDKVEKLGLKTHISQGEETLIVGLVGDTTRVDPKRIEVEESVERIMKVSEPYKLANRAFHPEDSVIDVAGIPVGGKALTCLICSSSKHCIISFTSSAYFSSPLCPSKLMLMSL